MNRRTLPALGLMMAAALAVALLSYPSATTRAADDRPATRPASAPSPKKVVLIAGSKSHGPEGNGVHDYGWSVRLLHALLERSNARDGLRAEHHLGGWPDDPAAVEDADAIVVISDGRDGDQYAEALHLASPARVQQVDRLMRRGCGLVLVHFSTFAPDRYAEQALRWVGGYFDWETDGKRQWYSAINTLDAEVTPLAPDHPVLRGVRPFRMREEFYYNLRFAGPDAAPAGARTTSLLAVPALGGREPDGNVVAWARERPGGGRGFATTCGHFYDNWRNDDFRRTVLNGIVWSAGAAVPAGGVEAAYIEREKL